MDEEREEVEKRHRREIEEVEKRHRREVKERYRREIKNSWRRERKLFDLTDVDSKYKSYIRDLIGALGPCLNRSSRTGKSQKAEVIAKSMADEGIDIYPLEGSLTSLEFRGGMKGPHFIYWPSVIDRRDFIVPGPIALSGCSVRKRYLIYDLLSEEDLEKSFEKYGLTCPQRGYFNQINFFMEPREKS